MSVFGSNEELVEKIKTQVSQIKKKGLNAEEFENLLKETRELYERILILRYKSFEEHTGKQDKIVPADVPANPKQEQTEPEVIKEIAPEPNDVENQEEEEFGFSLFGEIEENIEKEKPIEKNLEETIQPESLISNKVVPNPAKPPTSLLEKLSEQSNSNRLSDKLKLTKIDSLSSVFTLNDRIRFSQGLFKGSNEEFQAAVKTIESLTKRDEAFAQLEKYSTEFEWDMESKDVEHFYEFVERLYV